jgi:hypothetical protein
MKFSYVFLLLVLFSSIVFAEGYFWDVLRPATELAKQFEVPITYLLFLVSLVVFIISFLGWRKSKSTRILLISLAFFLFVLKWLIEIVDIYFSPGNFLGDASAKVFDFGIMFLIFVAIFYRKSWSKFFAREEK